MRVDAEEINRELELEFYLERESIPFRASQGVSGPQLNIRSCPFQDCQDSRYRTYYGIDTHRGNCFVCGRSFNLLGYIHHHQGGEDWAHTFRVAQEALREQGWRPKRATVPVQMPATVRLPISDPLPLEDGSMLTYLLGRGIDADLARHFHLRWCRYGWWQFTDDHGKTAMQDFSDRVIIPVFDLDGTLVTFQGRDLKPEMRLEDGTHARQRYLFPKTLPGTGRYLYNGQNVQATDHIVMGEGAFDAIAIKAALDEDVTLRHVIPVGSFGKHLSYGSLEGNDQLGRLSQLKRERGLKMVTIMWDGERAALEAALDAAKLIAGRGLTARIARLPQDKDPNEVDRRVVRDAFHAATIWTPALDIKWRLRNPYALA